MHILVVACNISWSVATALPQHSFIHSVNYSFIIHLSYAYKRNKCIAYRIRDIEQCVTKVHMSNTMKTTVHFLLDILLKLKILWCT